MNRELSGASLANRPRAAATRTSSGGLAALETAALLTVLAPILWFAIGLVVYLDQIRRLEDLVNRHVQAITLKPYHVGAGDQAYFYGIVDNNELPYDERLERLVDRMTNYTTDVRRDVRALLGCDAKDCPARYRIELRFADVWLTKDKGKVGGIRCKDLGNRDCVEIGPNRVECRICVGFFSDEGAQGANPRTNRYKIIRGRLPIPAAERLDTRIIDFVESHRDDQPFPYAVPCALAGVTQLQYYGHTEMRQGNEDGHERWGNAPINYLRVTAVVGLLVKVDLAQSFISAELLRRIGGPSGSTITNYRIFPIRQDL